MASTTRFFRAILWVGCFAVTGASSEAIADEGHEATPTVVDHAAIEHAAVDHAAMEGHGDATPESASAHSEHDAPPTVSDINWFYGFLGEEEGAEPSLLVRPKGMGTPFLATLLNWGALVGLIYVLGRKQLPIALAKRKAQIVQGMDDAAKMLAESKSRLAELDEKLAKTDSEIERIKTEMARAGELERERILEEAVERRVRMERDAHQLIETELDAARESLRRFVVEQALTSAKAELAKQIRPEDQQRLFEESLASLKKLPSRSLGGHA